MDARCSLARSLSADMLVDLTSGELGEDLCRNASSTSDGDIEDRPCDAGEDAAADAAAAVATAKADAEFEGLTAGMAQDSRDEGFEAMTGERRGGGGGMRR